MNVSSLNRVADPITALRGYNSNATNNKKFSASSSYYSERSVSVSYQKKNGDRFDFSVNEKLLKSEQIDILEKGKGDVSDSDKVFKVAKDEFLEMRKALVKKIMDSINGKKSEEESIKKDESVKVTKEDGVKDPLANLPEYWNAENTSQRIVDFATSFFSLSDSSAEDYYKMMKTAITDGYNSARKDLGELPDAVGKLSQDTYDLAIKKLDDWAKENGVDVDSISSESSNSASVEDLTASYA